MFNIYLNQWSRASLIDRQCDEKELLEYKIALSIISFVKNKFNPKKKPA